MNPAQTAMPTITPTTDSGLSHELLVRAAVLAPSPDNNQPWRFASRQGQLLVFSDATRQLPSDVGSMFEMLALGAATENACIAGRNMGYTPHVQFAGASGDRAAAFDGNVRGEANERDDPVATLSFSAGSEPDPLAPYIEARCTCRKPFSRDPIAPAQRDEIALQIAMFPEVQLDWLADRRSIRRLAPVVAQSDRIRFAYEPFHRELYRQLRFSAEEAERTRDGLDLRTLELPPGAASVLYWLRVWPRFERMNRLGLDRLLAIPSAQAVRGSGAIAVLSVAAGDSSAAGPRGHQAAAREYFAAGRAMQRFWLAGCAQQLSVHPLGSLPIFLAHLRDGSASPISPRHKRRIARLSERFERLVPAARGRVPVMLFRIGRSAPPSCRSLRRAVDSVIHPLGIDSTKGV